MPKLTGIFEQFRDLDKIPTQDISVWTKERSQLTILENYLGNRILYPQTIPVTALDMDIDYAILLEAARRQPELFFNPVQRKIMLSQEYFVRFPPLQKLLTSLITVLKPKGINTVFLSNGRLVTQVGSVIGVMALLGDKAAEFKDQETVTIMVNQKAALFKFGQIYIIPTNDRHNVIKIDGQNEIMVPGGEVGIFLDLRN